LIGLFAIKSFRWQNIPHSHFLANNFGKPLRAPNAGHNPKIKFGQGKISPLTSDYKISQERKLHAATERLAINRGHNNLPTLFNSLFQPIKNLIPNKLLHIFPYEPLYVGACAKDLWMGWVYDDHFYEGVGVVGEKSMGKLA
jgi:hypothetical protein